MVDLEMNGRSHLRRSAGPGFLAAGVLLVALAGAAAAASGPVIGQVKIAKGEVIALRDGEETPLETGSTVRTEDILRTGAASIVGVTFDDNSRVSLGPNSELELSTFSFGGAAQAEFELKLQEGSLSVASGQIASSREEAMRVLTPTTVLGVRGTEFLVRVAPKP